MRARPTIRSTALAAALLLAVGLSACTGGEDPGPRPTRTASQATPAPSPADPVRISVGVFGAEDEITGFESVVDDYNLADPAVRVDLQVWASREEARAALEAGETPDVFLASRRDLAMLVSQARVQPVDELLDVRGIDFGDGYARDALQAFSADNALQCMPYGISPMVVYYNTDLIDFERMRARGLDAPPDPESTSRAGTWNFTQFAAAAEFGTRPRRGTVGVSIEPTLRGLGPFLVAGGAQIFDDDTEPTSLDFSSEESRDALETTLELLRNPQLTLTEEQLARRDAVEWFERGKVAMITGFRDLVPRLRQVEGLSFDVMRMPVIEQSGTIGDITGLCLSADSEYVPEAADLMANLLQPDSLAQVTRAGALVPANLAVSSSVVFLQSGRLPPTAEVFNTGVRDIYVPPLLDSWTELDATVAPSLEELMTVPVLDTESIEEITTRIDEESRTVLDPEAVTSSPSASPTEDPSVSPTQDQE